LQLDSCNCISEDCDDEYPFSGIPEMTASSVKNNKDEMEVLTKYFRWVELGLSREPEILFNHSWIRYESSKGDFPTTLGPPDFVAVYTFNHSRDDINLTGLAREVQELVDNDLSHHGAMLFRNMPLSAKKFAGFRDAISWPDFQRLDPFNDRVKLENIDLAPADWPDELLPLHNEQSQNPRSPNKILLYCIESADIGGESIIGRNVDLTVHIPQWVIDYVRDDGYVVYDHWNMFDEDSTDDSDEKAWSWQRKTGASNRDDAIRILIDFGFNESAITVNELGTISFSNNQTNFFFDEQTQQHLWLNSISFYNAKRPNGDWLPYELYQAVELAEWKSSMAFTMQAGDLLVLDNMRVAHGRLPYFNGQGNERRLLTTYA
jgi:hypothetical protein